MQEVKWINRVARSLLGWMPEQEALLTLSGRNTNAKPKSEHEARARRAREIVASRPAGVDQTGVVCDAPPQLHVHIDRLREYAGAAPFFNEGWAVQLVDLRKVCSFQPSVTIDNAETRVAGLDSQNPESLASVSLPIACDTPLPAQFDPVRQAFVFSAANPNLRVVGQFSAPVGPGLVGFGFVVAESPSFLQVVKFQGRHFLRDGYHRAYAFLRGGISVVPAFVREVGATDEIGVPAGMLPQGAYLGDRPPLLPDFLNDDVAAEVRLPSVQKMIVVQAIELTPMVIGTGSPENN
jgi:hypothetical protein